MVGLSLVALGGVAMAQGPGYGFRGQGNCIYGFNRANLAAVQPTKVGTYGPGMGVSGGRGMVTGRVFSGGGRMGYGPCGGGFQRGGYGPGPRF
jgi:hypothetical protein